jgi:hypothetical protein
MDAELEALIKALDEFLHAAPSEAKHLEESYEARLEDVLQRKPNLSREALKRAVSFAHVRWSAAQKRFPSIPPKA